MLIDPKIYIPERIGHKSKRNSPMKALLCKAFGPAETLVLEDIASPQIKKNEILLDVHAAGVNFPDTLIIEGKYQFKPPFPFSPGGEAAGEQRRRLATPAPHHRYRPVAAPSNL